jgi:hypothetical protein
VENSRNRNLITRSSKKEVKRLRLNAANPNNRQIETQESIGDQSEKKGSKRRTRSVLRKDLGSSRQKLERFIEDKA